MEITRLRDVPGGFTVTELAERFAVHRTSMRDKVRLRLRQKEIERYNVETVVVYNGRSEHRMMDVLRLPNATEVDWKEIDKVFANRSNVAGNYAKYPLLPGLATSMEYLTFWNIADSTCKARLRNLVSRNFLKKECRMDLPYHPYMFSLVKKNDNQS